MGATGATGANGKDGVDGKDANETCKACHTSTKVDLISTQFQFSKHEYGEAAFEESGNTGCTPCHAQEAFKYVVANNVPSTFTLGSNGKYTNDYATIPSAAYGEIGCSTCHSALHTTYGTADLAFTTVAPVSMTMWGGKKTIDLPADNHKSNLCVKCHQPRPLTNLQTSNALDYDALTKNLTTLAYDANSNTATTNIIRPSYRTHVHYGAIGAVYAGMGGVEFAGTETYKNSAHTTAASCSDCHMGAMVGRAGGHTFSAAGKFDGCNASGCHSAAITSASTTFWSTPRAEIKGLIEQLGTKLSIGGVEIMNRNNDSSSNLWYGITSRNYDGYLNVYDPINNPNFAASNPSGTFQNPAPSSSTWTADQIAFNKTLPKISLTNAQLGAIINFQMCLRDYSLGIHNYAYTKALLKNSIAVLP
jgi:Cytochrome c552.